MPKVSTRSSVDAKTENLSSDEADKLQDSLQRSLEDTRVEDTEVLREKITEYVGEIMLAAEVARADLSGSFDGQSPSSGNFGIDLIHPGYLGYDDWDTMPDVTGGSTFDWLDDNTPDNLNAGGGAGGFSDPLKVGDPAVHIILGFGSYASDPVTSRVKEQKNDNPCPAVNTEDMFRNTDLRIKWKDTPVILQPSDTYAVRGYAGGETGTNYAEALYPVGLTFLEADKYRLLDPLDMAGTSDNDVLIET